MSRWVSGNQFRLLENGEEFFPRVFETIAAAKREVIVETFILFEDKVGEQLHAALHAAARRGVQVDLTIDGYGSPDLSPEFLTTLTRAGVRIHVFDPGARLWGWRTNLFRRMHRKIVVVDGERAFVGGINYSADHLADFGPEAKQDYAVEIEGPIVAVIDSFVHRALAAGHRNAGAEPPPGLRERIANRARTMAGTWRSDKVLAPAGEASAFFVTRDNRKHTNDIERHYRAAIRTARTRVVIANAYFFPGYRLLREMRRAARRGVDVRLILQGEPDMAIVKTAASMLYHHLLDAGVRIYEYCERPLHGKVAVIDDEWATVGSSNLDPLSLSLNLEANVVIRDRAFNQHLSERLDALIQHSCKQIDRTDLVESTWWRKLRSYFVFHLLRRYPAWAGWLPAHAPRLTPAGSLAPNPARPPSSPSSEAVGQAKPV
ncbi:MULTISPECIES: cardiolipin synthase ClsB [unclassified Polaromonas]|uniref:cardiolipin synthase ClsB n=1 Tax=unclassified Polaromonas TaxID=2638319 RepID=UPI000F07B080|nr:MULTISPECIES: cardiolipin synthase ClsB [unclassified Polaromonas]AYQ27734.1 cardiolipin synthase ClsB [Polaromonas sp. SP1]QGJ17413.1 cardiolipin synthase ClsB [Polaromonas sp. Pch-P]